MSNIQDAIKNATVENIGGVLDQIVQGAKGGDAASVKLLHAIDFQQQLTQALVQNTKNAVRALGIPAGITAVIAAAFASALEQIGLEVAPDIHKEFEEIRKDLANDAKVQESRAQALANFNARLELANRLKANGASKEEIKVKVAELYQAQLSNLAESIEKHESSMVV